VSISPRTARVLVSGLNASSSAGYRRP